MNNYYNKKKLFNHIENGILELLGGYELDNSPINNRDEFNFIYFSKVDFEINKDKVFLIVNEITSKFIIVYPRIHKEVQANTLKINRLALQPP